MMKTLPLTVLAVLLLACPAYAGEDEPAVIYEMKGETFNHHSWQPNLNLGGKMDMTVVMKGNGDKPKLTIHVWHMTPEGPEVEVKKYRVALFKATGDKGKTGKIELPEGRYRIAIYAERCAVEFRLTDGKRRR